MRKSEYELEMLMGIEAYLTDTDGIGGELRVFPEDFIVNEVSEIAPGNSGNELIIRVKKENRESHHLIRDISRQLRISDDRIGIAGTKDKRAITTQLMSISGADEESIKNISIPGVEITILGRSNKNIGLGDLVGNDFDITIRNIQLPSDEADSRITSISSQINATGGVPNYFGYQRFGIKRPVTHLVGEKLVKGDVEGAAMSYIALSYPYENQQNREARDMVWKTKDFKQGLEAYPLNLRYERSMMHYLIAHPDNYAGAFRSLSSNLLKMFVHAYQSYLFNKILSRRMLAGIPLSEPVEGDIICFTGSRMEPDTSRIEYVTKKNMPDIMYLFKRKKAYVTLPIIGKDTRLSEGMIGDIERKVLEEEGISPENFQVSTLPELTSAGLRREILLRSSPEFKYDNGTAMVKFFLSKGSYATTVLREFMKADPLKMD
jgi:tRNA pseudouridine13 synthase